MKDLKHTISYYLNGGRDPILTPLDELSRIRSLILTSSLLIACSLVFAVVHAAHGLMGVCIDIIVGITIGIINLYAIFKWDHLNINAHIIVATVLGVVLTSNILWGGFYDPNFGWLYIVPLVAALVLDLYAMWAYTVIITLLFIAYYYLQQHGLLPLHMEKMADYEELTMFNRFGFIYVLYIIIHAFSSERKHYEQALDDSRKKERIANQVKGKFLATISHEIKTPMAEILNMSDLLMRGKLNQNQLNDVQVIYQSGKLLVDLINDVLDYSKIDEGKMTIEKKPFNINSVIEDILMLTSHKAQAKNLKITHYISPDIPPILIGDSLRIKQILANLISNAITFTHEGKIHIHVNYQSLDLNTIELIIAIKDTGIGISQDMQQQIAATFQMNTSTHITYGGAGLGLSIAGHLALLMGGKIALQSELGTGSQFTVTLPMPIEEFYHRDIQSTAQAHTSYFLTQSATLIFSGKILIAEDNPINQALIKDQVDALKIACDLVSDGEQAVEALKKSHYDLILMDCHMPNVNGFTATRTIRHMSDTIKASIPIIALTANARQGDREHCLLEGMDDYLAKPFNREQLIYILNKWFNRSPK